MQASFQPGQKAAEFINKLFDTDVQKAFQKPKKADTETIFDGGKLKEVAHAKIHQGDLADFATHQETLAESVINAALLLESGTDLKTGDPKVTAKIFKEAVKKAGGDEQAKKDLAKDMKAYANQLREITFHRRGDLKSDMGVVDKEVFKHLGATQGQVASLMRKMFTSLVDVNNTLQDIDRYALNKHQVTIRSIDGRDITPRAGNLYEFTTQLLEAAMTNLKMVEGDGKEATLDKTALAVIDRFKEMVHKNFPDKNPTKLEADQLRNAMTSFLKELQQSGRPELKKLAFTLFSLNQCWVVQTGSQFSMIARETFGHDRFPSAATMQIHSQTHYDLQFDREGGITLQATTGHTNRDHATQGEEYLCRLTTTAKMNPKGDENLDVSFSMTLEHQVGHGEKVEKLKENLFLADYTQVKTRGVNINTPAQKQAMAAMTLIDAIRAKDLREVGVIRLSGTKTESDALAQKLIRDSDMREPDKRLLSGADIAKIPLNDLVSGLKFILREQLELIPENKLEAFLAAGAPDAPPDRMRALVASLPPENQRVLRNLCQLAHEVSALSDHNKMPKENIAVILGPTISIKADPLRFTGQKEAFLKLMEAFPPGGPPLL